MEWWCLLIFNGTRENSTFKLKKYFLKNNSFEYKDIMQNNAIVNTEWKKQLSKMTQDMYRVECQVLEGGKLPDKKHSSDAGFDLYAVEDITIYPGQTLKVPLNIKLKLPKGTWANITGKSGLGAQGLLVHAGVIDEEYRGVPHVVMANVNLIERLDEQGYPIMRVQPIVVKKGEKLAQLIMAPYAPHFFVQQVELVDSNTARSEGGFGSTGK